MDADLKAYDVDPANDGDLRDDRRGIEGTYLSALVELGDERIAPELAKRAGEAKTLRARRQWAQAAHFLGDPKPFASFAGDFRAGKIETPAGTGGDNELGSIVGALIGVGTPEAE